MVAQIKIEIGLVRSIVGVDKEIWCSGDHPTISIIDYQVNFN